MAAVSYVPEPKEKSRPFELQRERECMRAMGGGESSDSSPNLRCTHFIKTEKGRRRKEEDWVLKQKRQTNELLS